MAKQVQKCQFFTQSVHADLKPGCDNRRYYPI